MASTKPGGKIRVGIIFGGKSAEHEISLRSAKNVADAIDKPKFEVALIGIDKKGGWHIASGTEELSASAPLLMLTPENNGALTESGASASSGGSQKIDVAFPILHGPFGEDGTVQGLLKLMNVPFVGAGVLGSAVGMDKDVMKRLLRDAGISIGKYKAFMSGGQEKPDFAALSKELGIPLFVKPANMGSSVGVRKAANEKEFTDAVAEAFSFDTKILVEAFIDGREIECAILGNENPKASVPGEIVVKSDFYSYEAKYIDEDGAELAIPAKLDAETTKLVQETAIRTFQTLECAGLGRVDSFLTRDGRVFVNEINTMPGFTSISMYPKLWEASGISYTDLITKLIELALERHAKEAKLKTSYAD